MITYSKTNSGKTSLNCPSCHQEIELLLHTHFVGEELHCYSCNATLKVSTVDADNTNVGVEEKEDSKRLREAQLLAQSSKDDK